MDKVSRRRICAESLGRQGKLADKDVRVEQDEANWMLPELQPKILAMQLKSSRCACDEEHSA